MSGEKLYALSYTHTESMTVYVYADGDEAAEDAGYALIDGAASGEWVTEGTELIDVVAGVPFPEGGRAWAGGEDGNWTAEALS